MSNIKNKIQEKKNTINWENVFIMFLIGCVVGTFYEEALHYLKFGNFENRSALLWGPFNPVYGVGFTIFVIFLYPSWNSRSNFKNFVACAFLGGITEIMSSVVTELLFGIKAWDYSNHFMNIFGKTTIPFALFWGLGGYVIVTYIYPFLNDKLSHIVQGKKASFCKYMLIFMCVNLLATTIVVYQHVSRLNKVEQRGIIYQVIDNIYPEEYINKKFPNWMYEKNE